MSTAAAVTLAVSLLNLDITSLQAQIDQFAANVPVYQSQIDGADNLKAYYQSLLSAEAASSAALAQNISDAQSAITALQAIPQ